MSTFIRTGSKPSVGFVIPDNPNDCWLWQGSHDPQGYGQAFNPRLNRPDKAHRVVYEWINNNCLPPKASGLTLAHTCPNRSCVSHTQLATANHAKSPHSPSPIAHGSISGYNSRKCRCSPCTSAWTAYQRERRYQSKCATALSASTHHLA